MLNWYLMAEIIKVLGAKKKKKNTRGSRCLATGGYGFSFSRSTADVVTVLIVYQAFDNNVALDISKTSDRIWHTGLQGYVIPGHVFQFIQSFLSTRKMNVILKGLDRRSFHRNVIISYTISVLHQ